jgi:hypothetical protein
MPITLSCACGKSLRVPDKHAGKRVKCPACGAIVAAEPEVFDDFEVVEETAGPTAAPARPRVKAVAEEEPAAPPPPPKAKKKKKKKKTSDAEEGDDWYEQMRANEAWTKRVTRGSAFIVLGLLIVAGVAIAFFRYSEELKEVGGKTVVGMIVFGVVGLAAIGKGVIGLVFGQFLGEDDT